MLIKIATMYDIPEIEICGKISLPIYYKYDDLIEIINSNNNKILIARNDSKLCGFIIFKINQNKNIHINSIAINPDYRRFKIGTKLINNLKYTYLQNNITLYVQTTNTNAISFYKNNSFKIYQEMIDYYSNLECNNAYIMIYEITTLQYTPK